MIFGKIEISAFRIFQNGFYPHIWSTHQPQSIHSRLLSEKFVLQLWICLWFIVISCVYAPNKNWKLEMATDARIAITFTCTLDKVFHVMYVWAVFFLFFFLFEMNLNSGKLSLSLCLLYGSFPWCLWRFMCKNFHSSLDFLNSLVQKHLVRELEYWL